MAMGGSPARGWAPCPGSSWSAQCNNRRVEIQPEPTGSPRLIEAYFIWVLAHPRRVVLWVVLITVLAMLNVTRGVVNSNIEQLFFGEDPAFQRYRTQVEEFVNDETMAFAYRDEAPLSAESKQRLERAVEAVEALPEVRKVHSLLDAVHVEGANGQLRVDRYFTLAERDEAAAMAALRADSALRGALISGTGHAAMLVELTVNPDRPGESGPVLVDDVMEALTQAGFTAETHRAGWLVVLADTMRATYRNLGQILPLVCVVLFVVVLLLFQQIAPAVTCLGVAGVAAIWSLGFSVLLDRNISVFVSAIPGLVMVVAFSDIVHLWSAYQVERATGKEQRAAVLRAATDVGRACLFTSATTAVGFFSLALIPTPMMRQAGLVMGFGVGVALLLAMTLVPLVLVRVGRPAPQHQIGGWARARVRDVVDLCRRVTIGRPRLLLAIWGLVTVLFVLSSLQVVVETDFSARFSADHRHQVDQRFFQTHFAGSNGVELHITTDQPGGVLEPEVMGGLWALHQDLEALPEVDKALGLAELMTHIHQALGGEGDLPDTRAGIAQELLLFEMGGGSEGDLKQFVDFERKTTRLRLQLAGSGARHTREVGDMAARIAQDRLGAQVQVEPIGLVYLLGDWLDEIVAGQRQGMAVSFTIITLMMIWALGSIRAGLFSMLPNGIPLLAVGAYCGLMWDKTDSDTFTAMVMAIGIGVDDTIHFLVRYRTEREAGHPIDKALERTFAFSGRAIVLTTIILALGFLPFALSEYFSSRMIGTLIPLALVAALFADLLLVPAMCKLRWIDVGQRRGPEAGEG
jgi:predicted RND superfamily exporter protein